MIKELSSTQQLEFLQTLQTRFQQNPHRHKKLEWNKILVKLKASPEKLWSLHQMEQTCGEPDVISYDSTTQQFMFCDCAKESPSGRRSLCYDQAALIARKKYPPKDSAINMATTMGIDLLTEAQYRTLQQLGPFDTKTSTWLHTPDPIRQLGGAIFGDYRYGQTFVYHNGADSYYAARGFRGVVWV